MAASQSFQQPGLLGLTPQGGVVYKEDANDDCTLVSVTCPRTDATGQRTSGKAQQNIVLSFSQQLPASTLASLDRAVAPLSDAARSGASLDTVWQRAAAFKEVQKLVELELVNAAQQPVLVAAAEEVDKTARVVPVYMAVYTTTQQAGSVSHVLGRAEPKRGGGRRAMCRGVRKHADLLQDLRGIGLLTPGTLVMLLNLHRLPCSRNHGGLAFQLRAHVQGIEAPQCTPLFRTLRVRKTGGSKRSISSTAACKDLEVDMEWAKRPRVEAPTVHADGVEKLGSRFGLPLTISGDSANAISAPSLNAVWCQSTESNPVGINPGEGTPPQTLFEPDAGLAGMQALDTMQMLSHFSLDVMSKEIGCLHGMASVSSGL